MAAPAAAAPKLECYHSGAVPLSWGAQPPPENFGVCAWLDLCAWVDVHFPRAQHEIGLRVSEGRDGAKHDLPLAYEWLRKSGEQGYAPAMLSAAILLNKGIRGAAASAKEHALANDWLQRCIKASSGPGQEPIPLAHAVLGDSFERGRGCEANLQRAHQCFSEAVRLAELLKRDKKDYKYSVAAVKRVAAKLGLPDGGAPGSGGGGTVPPGWEGQPPPEDFGDCAWLDLCAWVDANCVSSAGGSSIVSTAWRSTAKYIKAGGG